MTNARMCALSGLCDRTQSELMWCKWRRLQAEL